jgi:two-component system OmpR family response regulator
MRRNVTRRSKMAVMSALPPFDILLVHGSAHLGHGAMPALASRFVVHATGTIDHALEAAREHGPRLIIIADDLPEARAMTLLRGLMPLWHGPYVLLGDARHDVAEQVVALEAGFDDVWPLDIDPRLALARARALMRRPQRDADIAPDGVQAFGLALDRTRRVASYAERSVTLSPREVDMLTALLQARGRVVERTGLRVADSLAPDLSPEAIDAVVVRLRRRLAELGADRLQIATVRGRGYSLQRRGAAAESTKPLASRGKRT